VASTVTEELQHVIGGQGFGSGDRERRNPADPTEIVARYPVGGVADVHRAIDAASAAFPAWAETPAPERGAILTKAAAILESRLTQVARDLTREEGKTIGESTGEVRRAVDILRYFGGEGWRLSSEVVPASSRNQILYTKREPLGVIAVITPWNFPIAIPSWKIAPALVAGNAVVFKPASITPLTAHHLVRALVDADLPNGVLNLIYGAGTEVGDALVGHEAVAAVSFTGSTSVGKRIHDLASKRMARVQLEMGGKNPFVVAEDASVAEAAGLVAVGGWGLTGQACTATSRVIVVGPILGPLIEALKGEAAIRTPGNGLESSVRMGPVVSEGQLATDMSYLEVGRKEAELVTGGRLVRDFLLEPTLFVGVKPQHRIAREEIFGPVIGVIAVSDLDEAIAIANDSQYGLSAGICTNDMAVAHHFIDRIEAGVVKVNQPTTGLELNMPFGGIKNSSTGTFREQGRSAVDFYSRTKSVYLRYGEYPPKG
jgi:acyl-CoA reductase-like NAD-dependent aldehyde dehydrogenase